MGSKRLNDVVTGIVEMVLEGEVDDKRRAAVESWDDIDDDGQYIAGIEGVVARIEKKARDLKVAIGKKFSAAQPELPFNLPAAVAMDIDGTRILPTRNLRRNEFMRAIQIREQQIKNDQRSLREWKSALKQADIFWAKHPSWSFGDCLDAMMGRVEEGTS
jgi:hypothetical protein